MLFNVKGFITSKRAEAYKDCADHYAYNTQLHRFAIADGVTRSFFPKLWSKILVEQSVASVDATDLPLEASRAEWLSQVKQRVSCPDVKWFTMNAFVRKDAAMSTLVSLEFDEENMSWKAFALGDSFLFFVPKGREDDMDQWVKLSSKSEPVEFDNYPDYLSSRGENKGQPQSLSVKIEEGIFYLMTDALSEWMFMNKAEALRIIQKEWTDQQSYQESIDRLRSAGQLHDDDSAVLMIQVEDDGNDGISYQNISVTSLEELVRIDEILAQCRQMISTQWNNLKEAINHIVHNENLSENAKHELEEKLSEEYAHAYRNCDSNE